MNSKVFSFVYFLLISELEATNKIGFEKCDLDEVSDDLTQFRLRKAYKNSSGFGPNDLNYFQIAEFASQVAILNFQYLWNKSLPDIAKMSQEALTQMCYCAFKRFYSFEGEKSSIEYEIHYKYWREIPYLGWQKFLVFQDEAIKCYIPNGRYFFLIETQFFYIDPNTRDLFVLEVSEADLGDKDLTVKNDRTTMIRFPTGQFKAFIPKVNLVEITVAWYTPNMSWKGEKTV